MNRRLELSAFVAVVTFAFFAYDSRNTSEAQVVPRPAGDEELPIGWDQSPRSAPTEIANNPATPPSAADGSAAAFLGVTFDPQSLKAAVALSVAPGSPAEHAGLRPGDTIEALNGRLVSGYQDVLDAVRWMKPGDSVDLQVSRRVSLRTRAVLASAGTAVQHTTNYRPTPIESSPDVEPEPTVAPELLPTPNRSPRFQQQLRRSTQQTRQYTESPRLRIIPFGGEAPPNGLNGVAANRRESDDGGQRETSDENDGRRRGLFSRRRN